MGFRGPEALNDRVERRMVAITADLKTKGLAVRMGHFALTGFHEVSRAGALNDSLVAVANRRHSKEAF